MLKCLKKVTTLRMWGKQWTYCKFLWEIDFMQRYARSVLESYPNRLKKFSNEGNILSTSLQGRMACFARGFSLNNAGPFHWCTPFISYRNKAIFIRYRFVLTAFISQLLKWCLSFMRYTLERKFGPYKSRVPNLWYAYNLWYAMVFQVVREKLPFFHKNLYSQHSSLRIGLCF